MKIVTKDSETKLLEVVSGLQGDSGGYYALHFHLSKLGEQYRSEYQIKIAINILNDLFKVLDSIAFGMTDCDIILLYNGNNKGLLEKSIFQLRYLFMDDPLGYGKDGLENDDFCTVYDLEFQWRDFFSMCLKKSSLDQTFNVPEQDSPIQTTVVKRAKLHLMTPSALVKIMEDINKVSIAEAIRSQAVCAIVAGRQPQAIFEEVYIHVDSLSKIIKTEADLFSNIQLFNYLTETFDKIVLLALKLKARQEKKFANSLNLNVRSLFSEEFASFDSHLTAQQKSSTILEIQVSDVFENIPRFMIAREAVQKLGYRICIDGLEAVGFSQVDRKSLGFDLAKVQWSNELNTIDGKAKKEMLSNAVKNCDPRRIILCRCDSEDAIEYGKSIGISLFQGWYIDKLLNNENG